MEREGWRAINQTKREERRAVELSLGGLWPEALLQRNNSLRNQLSLIAALCCSPHLLSYTRQALCIRNWGWLRINTFNQFVFSLIESCFIFDYWLIVELKRSLADFGLETKSITVYSVIKNLWFLWRRQAKEFNQTPFNSTNKVDWFSFCFLSFFGMEGIKMYYNSIYR